MFKKQGECGKNKINFYQFLLIFFHIFCFGFIYSADSGIDVGNKSIDFSLRQVSSTATFRLSDYENISPVLLNFFATWCPSCRQEIPELNRIYREYGKKGLEIVSVNVQENETAVADFAGKKKIIYRILLDSSAVAVKKFKVYGLPTNILIDSKGIIVFRGYDLPENEEIERVLVISKKESGKRKPWGKK